jgi:allantoate deiminase
MDWGKIAQERLNEIAKCSLPSAGVTRFPFTKEHELAIGVIKGWMEQANLSVSMDAAGTLLGRTEGSIEAPAFLIGSHQDSVRDGGRYDGIMGIVVGCLALEKLKTEGINLPFAVEVLAFADEEGVRFPTALMGPRSLAGTFDPKDLELKDRDGVSLRDALAKFGGKPEKLLSLKRKSHEILGYLEVHIEQGPILENQNSALGVVSGICGIERHEVTFVGETGHAGTVPMSRRRDALLAASEFIVAVNHTAIMQDKVRATIGSLRLWPDVVNAIPNKVTLTLEIRALDDQQRQEFHSKAQNVMSAVSQKCDVSGSMRCTYSQPAVLCDEGLSLYLNASALNYCSNIVNLPSGATHDASAMADLCPIAMLFVRCAEGKSHTPLEAVKDVDMTVAIDTVADFLKNLSP